MNPEATTLFADLDTLHWVLGGSALLFLILFLTQLLRRSAGPAPAEPEAAETTPAPKAKRAGETRLRETSPDAALQLLSLLQQEARLLDFVHEDLTGFSDADVGAAARVVHAGGRKVLDEYFDFSPVREEDEDSPVTLPEGFNPAEVRLTGHVVGQAPFSGTLIHRGWRVTEVRLPKLAPGHDAHIVAPAEVEL
jgi:hypothetical protein